MNPGLRASASGMLAQQLKIDTIANNLANVNTTAFKRSRTSFEDALYETLQGARVVNYQSTETVPPIQIGRGVRLAAIVRNEGQGALEPTSRPLDMAIEGEGYFQVQRPDGSVVYTRDGSFSISDTGQLVTHQGFTVLPGFTLPPDSGPVAVSPTGVLSVIPGSGSQAVELGRLELARFLNPSGLVALGGNLYGESPASGTPMTGQPQEEGFGQVLGSHLESSNVEIVQEMVDMISAQRAYEVNAKAIRTAEDMIEVTTNGLIR
jgi:flagellar basal-body rod protein FlgG